MAQLVPDPIERYSAAHTTPEAPWLTTVADATERLTKVPQMLTGHVEGRFLEFLVWALQPRLVVEIGTFTAYGTLSMAAGLPAGGRIITCELDETHAALAGRHIAESPFAASVDLRVGPALETIRSIEEPVDFAFIDADKESYLDYYEALVPKLAARGVIAADNVLWGGAVVDEAETSASTVAIRAFNDRVAADDRVTCVMTTIRDGITLIRRR